MAAMTTMLLTVTGRDRPGVTASLFSALQRWDVDVLDIEQLVARGRLVLVVLTRVPETGAGAIADSVRAAVAELGMHLDVEIGPAEDEPTRRHRSEVTVLGSPLRPASVTAIAREIAAHGGNIDRIRRVAAYPVTAVVLECSGTEPSTLRRSLALAAASTGVDASVRPVGLDSRGPHLVVMDVDSTLIQDEVIELLAARAGALDEVSRITERAMHGELDFAASLRARVALLTGLPDTVFDEVRAAVSLTPGARTLCRTLARLGYHVALVSGGFHEVVDPIAADLGIGHVRANRLEVVDGHLTGRVVGPVIDRQGKRDALVEFAAEHGVPLARTVAIGDGANDIDMLTAAGLGVAFNGKPALQAAADTSVTVPYLDSVLFLLGITREEIELADEADGLPVRPSTSSD